jgi:hypothetical protein
MGLIDGIDVPVKPVVHGLTAGTDPRTRQQNTPDDQNPIVSK